MRKNIELLSNPSISSKATKALKPEKTRQYEDTEERKWVEAMAAKRNLYMDDYDYEELRGKMLNAYYTEGIKANKKRRQDVEKDENKQSRILKVNKKMKQKTMSSNEKTQETSQRSKSLDLHPKDSTKTYTETNYDALSKGVDWRKRIMRNQRRGPKSNQPCFSSEYISNFVCDH